MRAYTLKELEKLNEVRVLYIPTDYQQPCQFIKWSPKAVMLPILREMVRDDIEMLQIPFFPDAMDWRPVLIVGENARTTHRHDGLNLRATELRGSHILGPAVLMQEAQIRFDDGEDGEDVCTLPLDWEPGVTYWNGIKTPIFPSDLKRSRLSYQP